MIIHARTSPVELLLCLYVWDTNGSEVSPIIYLDTDKMVAKQYVRTGGVFSETSIRTISASRFEFRVTAQITEDILRDLLPSDLHDSIVDIKT